MNQLLMVLLIIISLSLWNLPLFAAIEEVQLQVHGMT